MTLEEMLTALKVEVQNASAVDADLTRAIKKSVSLLSRLLPKREVLETTIIIDVDSESFTTPATASATAIVNAQTLNGVVDGGTLTIADKTPDVPRKLTVTLTDANASVTALTIIVKGYDLSGNYVEETWVLRDLPSGTAVQGKRYFKYVSEVEVDDIAGTAAAADTISVGTGNAYDSYISLANKAIDPESETVTSSPAGTTYTRDTDYRIDYINGAIKFINGGEMAAGTAYLVSYDLDNRMLDISTLLPEEDYIKIERIEYPAGEDPPTNVTFETIGDILLIKGKDATFVEDKHLRIHYLKPWTAPATLAQGDYPTHLDNAIIIGSAGQYLIFMAEKHIQTAITDALASKTLLDAIAAVAAVTAPDISAYLTAAETALAAAIARFAAAVLEADKGDTPLASSATAMGKVATEVAAGEAYLALGDTKITTINDAERVAEKYAEYTQVEALMADAYGKESDRDILLADAWERRAGREMAIGNGYVQEAVQRLAEASRNLEKYQLQIADAGNDIAYFNAQVAQAKEYQNTAAQYLNIAGRYLASGQAKINEMLSMLGLKAEFNFYKGSSEQFS